MLDVNYQNTIADTQTLYVRLEVDETGCYATTTQELIVHPLAVIEVSNYELCDYTNPGDLIGVLSPTYAMYKVYSNIFQLNLEEILYIVSLRVITTQL